MAGLAQPLGDVGVLGEGGAERRRGVLQLRGGGQQQGLGVPLRVAGPLARSAISAAISARAVAVPGVHSVSCWASRQLARVAGSSRVRAMRTASSASGRARGRSAGTECCSWRASAAVTFASVGVPVPRRASRAVSSTATRSARGMAKRAPMRSRPSATAPSRSASPVAVARAHAVSSSSRASGGVAGPQPQVRLGGEQADQVGVGQPLAGVGDRRPHPGQVAGGLGEREPRRVGAGGGVRPGQRRCGVRTGMAAAKWRASSAANTGLPRSCRRSSALATRWCRSSRRAGGRPA